MTIRQEMEKLEQRILSPMQPYGANRGRQYPQEQCRIRTDFQRDRIGSYTVNPFEAQTQDSGIYSTGGDHFEPV